MPILLYIAMWGAWMGMWDTRFGMPAPAVKPRPCVGGWTPSHPGSQYFPRVRSLHQKIHVG
jgi:hypothetical protein